MNFCGTTDGQINGMIEEAQLQLEDPFLERGQRADLIDHIDICMIELAKRQNRKIFQPLD